MFEQLSELVNQYGQDAVVNNTAVPNEHNDSVMNEVSSSILDGLKNNMGIDNVNDIAGMFQGINSGDSSNPLIKNLIGQVSGSLGTKFGLSNEVSADVANNLIPQVMNNLVSKANDPNDSSFNFSDIIKWFTAGGKGG